METRCVKIKLKPGSLERVRAWAAELNRRPDEVLATLRDEQVIVEAVFLDSNSDGDYLIYFMKAVSFEHAYTVVQKSPHPIDAYHEQFKRDTWDGSKVLETLIDFDRIES
ncbi:MAG TPA: DUF6176 family protein [Chloroflexia bacterium]|nr:DUF6176 family protein [Chloroflexia bacterium]